MTKIEKNAFNTYNRLQAVYSYNTQPTAIADDAFSTTTYRNGTLLVPKGCTSKYISLEGWKNFLTIVEMGDDVQSIEKIEEDVADGELYDLTGRRIDARQVQKGRPYAEGGRIRVRIEN